MTWALRRAKELSDSVLLWRHVAVAAVHIVVACYNINRYRVHAIARDLCLLCLFLVAESFRRE